MDYTAILLPRVEAPAHIGCVLGELDAVAEMHTLRSRYVRVPLEEARHLKCPLCHRPLQFSPPNFTLDTAKVPA